MGKWQMEYYDQVLGLKLKTLVCGAIARAKLERDDPQSSPLISYESFVQSLDHGDSFTTTLVDILVKELAERQKRPSSSDRHLLAERTAASLKSLSRCRTYRAVPIQRNPFDFYVSRSSDNTLSDWNGNPVRPDPWDLEIDEEEVDPPTPPSPSDPTVFQPFADPSAPLILRRSFPVQTIDVSTDEETQHPSGYPSRRSPPSIPHYNLSRHSSLTREPSIRRPARSRTNDFNDFTSRRRALGRSDSTADNAPDGPERPSSTSASRPVSSDVNATENTHNATAGAEIDNALPIPSSTNGNPLLRRNEILRLRSLAESEYTLESLRSNFNLYGSSSNSAAPSSSRLTVHMPHLRRPRIRRSNQQSGTSLPSGDGYTSHPVRAGSPPASNSAESLSSRLPLPRFTSPIDLEYLHRLPPPSLRGRSPLYSAEFTPPHFPDANDVTTPGGNRQNREPTSTINLPTPRSISPEGGSSSQ